MLVHNFFDFDVWPIFEKNWHKSLLIKIKDESSHIADCHFLSQDQNICPRDLGHLWNWTVLEAFNFIYILFSFSHNNSIWHHIETSSTTLKMMKFYSILPHMNYLNAGKVWCTISKYLKIKWEQFTYLSLSLSLSLSLPKKKRLVDISTVATALFLLTDN